MWADTIQYDRFSDHKKCSLDAQQQNQSAEENITNVYFMHSLQLRPCSNHTEMGVSLSHQFS